MTTSSEGEGPQEQQGETAGVPPKDAPTRPPMNAGPQPFRWTAGVWVVIGIAVVTLLLAIFM